jgi:DNA-binding XRE family transcriptional regulator
MGINIEKFYDEVGSRIKEARTKASINQETLGTLLGLTRTSIVNIENGRQRPSLHLLFAISKAVNINFNDLMPKMDFPTVENAINGVLLVNKNDIQTSAKISRHAELSLNQFLVSIKK